MNLEDKEINISVGKREVITVLGVIIGLFLVYIAVTGLIPDETEGTCYTRMESCVGLSYGGNCYGVENVDYDYVSEDRCDQLEDIKQDCEEIRTAVCESELLDESDWPGNTDVEGRSCDVWMGQYDLDISRSC